MDLLGLRATVVELLELSPRPQSLFHVFLSAAQAETWRAVVEAARQETRPEAF